MLIGSMTRFFEQRPHLIITLPNGREVQEPLFNVRGYHIVKFRFVNCENLRITEHIMSWFTEEFLPQVRTDDFMFQVSMSTAPADLQHRLTQYKGTY